MAQKRPEGQKRKAPPRKEAREETAKVVLVGTYKGDQLTRWRGWYNYPISEGDFNVGTPKGGENKQTDLLTPNGVRGAGGAQLVATGKTDAMNCVPPDFSRINELWLFNGTKGRKTFKAEFVGVKTREELIRDYGYPAKGKAHGERYLLFKTEFMYQHKLTPPEEAERVVVRTADFARSPKIRSQLKAYLESPDRNDPDLAKRLPKIITKLRPDQLRVCETAVQLDFWLSSVPADVNPSNMPICTNSAPAISFRNEHGILYLGDSLTWLKGLPSASVDLIFADPPYSIGKAEWDLFCSHEEYLLWCERWIGECSRILTAKGTCYICGFSEILSDVKYRTQRFFNGCRWIVWHYRNKANLGMDWGRSHESLLHFRKAKTTVLNIDDIRIPYSAHTLKYPVHPQADSSAYGNGKSNVSVAQWRPNEKGAKPKDVFDIPTTCNGMGEKTPHPTQKPEELVRKLVLASSREGDLVLDPFSGSGTTAVVAQQLHRRWLACDRNMEYNQWAMQRLQHVPNCPVQYWIELDREVSKRRESIR